MHDYSQEDYLKMTAQKSLYKTKEGRQILKNEIARAKVFDYVDPNDRRGIEYRNFVLFTLREIGLFTESTMDTLIDIFFDRQDLPMKPQKDDSYLD